MCFYYRGIPSRRYDNLTKDLLNRHANLLHKDTLIKRKSTDSWAHSSSRKNLTEHLIETEWH